MQATGPTIFHNNQKHHSLTDVKTRNTQICLIILYDPSMYLRLGYWHGTPAPPKLPTIYLTVAFADAIALWNVSVRNKASLKVLNAWLSGWVKIIGFGSWMNTLLKKIVQQYRTVPIILLNRKKIVETRGHNGSTSTLANLQRSSKFIEFLSYEPRISIMELKSSRINVHGLFFGSLIYICILIDT